MSSKAKHPVPKHPSNRVFFRNVTKQALREGDLVSDSDEDPDEEWLLRKHDDIIDDFTDLLTPEKEYIKRFDRFMATQPTPADVHLPETLFDFVNTNVEWLRKSEVSMEFLKHGSMLVLHGRLDRSVMRACAIIIMNPPSSTQNEHREERQYDGLSTSSLPSCLCRLGSKTAGMALPAVQRPGSFRILILQADRSTHEKPVPHNVHTTLWTWMMSTWIGLGI
ncbi:MAG: hypothetical protein M1838_000057 [Thelocarpon superellum]|nr:MAG: hypothetical protein M1838_000057 [Thelocarpon superellum]